MLSVENVIAYCCEDISLIENYDKAIADTTQTWHCHHRLEIQGNLTLTAKELKLQRLYYNRPASELIFLTSKEHVRLHRLGKKFSKETCLKFSKYHTGLKHTEETKARMSQSHKGKKHTEEAKAKISQSHKGKKLSEEHKQKLSLTHKGKPTWNKGKKMSEETKKKMSETRKGKPSPKKGKTYKQKENK